ncbi:preprotein translocase subunit SecG [Roseivirga sp. BDSF3-8]|uniref:preprotein translocase subunit SecG n=1 Tax=Roseivirga sp. BDSF3-8 TaxID=3241598 RepID=UPI003532420E
MFIIISISIFVALLLILVVLAQNSKGGGLSSQFTGGGANQIIGVKRTTDLLEKVTWTLAIGLVILCVSSSFVIDDTAVVNDEFTSPNLERAREDQPGSLFESTQETLEENAPDQEMEIGTATEEAQEGNDGEPDANDQ